MMEELSNKGIGCIYSELVGALISLLAQDKIEIKIDKEIHYHSLAINAVLFSAKNKS